VNHIRQGIGNCQWRSGLGLVDYVFIGYAVPSRQGSLYLWMERIWKENLDMEVEVMERKDLSNLNYSLRLLQDNKYVSAFVVWNSGFVKMGCDNFSQLTF